MKPLPIVWQRLVDSTGRTCNRCGSTQEPLERAVAEDADRRQGALISVIRMF